MLHKRVRKLQLVVISYSTSLPIHASKLHSKVSVVFTSTIRQPVCNKVIVCFLTEPEFFQLKTTDACCTTRLVFILVNDLSHPYLSFKWIKGTNKGDTIRQVHVISSCDCDNNTDTSHDDQTIALTKVLLISM